MSLLCSVPKQICVASSVAMVRCGGVVYVRVCVRVCVRVMQVGVVLCR